MRHVALLLILCCCGCGSTAFTVRSDYASLYEAGVRACTTMGYARLDAEHDVFDRRHGLISLSRRERFMAARRAIVNVQRDHPEAIIPRECKVCVREEDTISFILTLFIGGNERLEEREALLVDMIREYHASGATGPSGGER